MIRTLFAAAVLFAIVPACAAQDMGEEMGPAPVVRENTEARPSPNASVSQTIGTTVATVTYGRPSVRGRAVFGAELVPFDAVWRAGANEASTLTVSAPVMVGGEALPAGTYSFFVIPTAESWTFVVNATAAQWGAYRYDPAQDVLRTTVPVESGLDTQEQFLITFEEVTDTGAHLVLRWADTRAAVPITLG